MKEKRNEIRIVRDNRSDYTFTDDTNRYLHESKSDTNKQKDSKENINIKSKKISNKELKAKGLKFSTPSSRNHSSVYE